MKSSNDAICSVCGKNPCICKTNKQKITVIIVAFLVIGIMAYGMVIIDKNGQGDFLIKDVPGEKTEQMMMKDELKMKVDTAMPENNEMTMKSTGYMNYDHEKVKEVLASGKKVILFFYAPWCPTCRALDAGIEASLSSIPEDAIIVKVDYDSVTDMKKKYGVTSQHTTVLIDKDMNLVSKKIGARNVTEIFN